MLNVDRWDILLMLVVGYVAITVLVRLMISHRNRLVSELREQMVNQRKQKKRRAPPRKSRGRSRVPSPDETHEEAA